MLYFGLFYAIESVSPHLYHESCDTLYTQQLREGSENAMARMLSSSGTRELIDTTHRRGSTF